MCLKSDHVNVELPVPDTEYVYAVEWGDELHVAVANTLPSAHADVTELKAPPAPSTHTPNTRPRLANLGQQTQLHRHPTNSSQLKLRDQRRRNNTKLRTSHNVLVGSHSHFQLIPHLENASFVGNFNLESQLKNSLLDLFKYLH